MILVSQHLKLNISTKNSFLIDYFTKVCYNGRIGLYDEAKIFT